MEAVDKVLKGSLDNYYNRLFNVGYKNDDTIKRLLVLMYIQEILGGHSLLNQYVTERDYNLMLCVLSCLYDSDCVIGRPDISEFDMTYYNDPASMPTSLSLLNGDDDDSIFVGGAQDDFVRETEWDVQRSSTENILRKKVIATHE